MLNKMYKIKIVILFTLSIVCCEPEVFEKLNDNIQSIGGSGFIYTYYRKQNNEIYFSGWNSYLYINYENFITSFSSFGISGGNNIDYRVNNPNAYSFSLTPNFALYLSKKFIIPYLKVGLLTNFEHDSYFNTVDKNMKSEFRLFTGALKQIKDKFYFNTEVSYPTFLEYYWFGEYKGLIKTSDYLMVKIGLKYYY